MRAGRGVRVQELELRLRLGELPSVQHQSGLGGLVVALECLGREADTPRFEVAAGELRLVLRPQTLSRLLVFLYASVEVVRSTSNRPSAGLFETELVEEGYGQTSARYVYRDRRPAGQWLLDLGCDEVRVGAWRDAVWSHLRDRPTTRLVYSNRPDGLAEEIWKALVRSRKLDISSALFIGARSANGEGIPFEDRPEHGLLLHFSHMLARPFPIFEVNDRGETSFAGLAWTVPVPRSLLGFSTEIARHLVADLPTRVASPQEAALAMLNAVPASVLDGVFCAHLEKRGHNVLVRTTAFVPSETPLLQPYRELVAPLRNLKLRRLALHNLLLDRPVQRGVWALPWLGDSEGEFSPDRDFRRLAAGELGFEALEGLMLKALDEKARHRFPRLSRQDYLRGRGFPSRREKFRQSWLSVTRHFLAQLRNARTRKLLEGLFRLPSSYADTPWKELRDSLALAIGSCSGVGSGGGS